MDFPLIDWVDCAICNEEAPRKSNIMLDCSHEYHISCLREYLRVLRSGRNNPDAHMRCPQCRKKVSRRILDGLWYELRSLNFRYTLPPHLSGNPDSFVCVAIEREGEREDLFVTEPMRVGNLPRDLNCPGQVYVATYLDVEVSDPETQYNAWVQDGDTGVPLTPKISLATTSQDDPDDSD